MIKIIAVVSQIVAFCFNLFFALCMPRQEVAFLRKSRKIKGCGSLERDFYTRFKPKNKGFWAVTWRKNKQGLCLM